MRQHTRDARRLEPIVLSIYTRCAYAFLLAGCGVLPMLKLFRFSVLAASSLILAFAPNTAALAGDVDECVEEKA